MSFTLSDMRKVLSEDDDDDDVIDDAGDDDVDDDDDENDWLGAVSFRLGAVASARATTRPIGMVGCARCCGCCLICCIGTCGGPVGYFRRNACSNACA